MAHKWLPVFGQPIDFVLKQQEYAHPTEKVPPLIRDLIACWGAALTHADPVLHRAGAARGAPERTHGGGHRARRRLERRHRGPEARAERGPDQPDGGRARARPPRVHRVREEVPLRPARHARAARRARPPLGDQDARRCAPLPRRAAAGQRGAPARRGGSLPRHPPQRRRQQDDGRPGRQGARAAAGELQLHAGVHVHVRRRADPRRALPRRLRRGGRRARQARRRPGGHPPEALRT